MKIIAFDLGKSMAWAHNARGLTVASHSYEGPRAHRLSALMDNLDKYFTDSGFMFHALVYETPFARGRDATRSLWGIAGILEAIGTNYGMAVVDVAVPTIKKFATGHGFASKDAMIEAAKRFGYRGNNEHEADAVCLLRYAEANLEKK